jgi:predicted chitinase
MYQLTWKETYAACSREVFRDDRLVRDPDQVAAKIEVNIKATAWYWRDYKPFNRLADDENVDEIIYRLYGGRITSHDPRVRESVIRRRSYYATIKALLRERVGS